MKKKIYLAGAMGCYTDCPQKATQWREDVSKIIWERGCENKWSIKIRDGGEGNIKR